MTDYVTLSGANPRLLPSSEAHRAVRSRGVGAWTSGRGTSQDMRARTLIPATPAVGGEVCPDRATDLAFATSQGPPPWSSPV